MLMLVAAVPAAAETVARPARTLARDGVTVAFPAVTYEAPATTTPVVAVCAQMAAAALGVPVDPARHLMAETLHRVVFRDPSDAGFVVKLYRPDRYDPPHVAKMIQRDLAVQALLVARGLRVATLDRNPGYLRHGVLRQAFVRGTGVDEAYPQGYRPGADPALDRALAVVAAIDKPLRTLVSMQTGLVFTNTVDCRTEQPLGVDLGHCYANIVLEQGSGQPIFVDW
jgi:hypothetical protein